MSNDIHPAEVAALISYDPVTGKFHWKPRPSALFNTARAAKTWNTRFAGAETCTTDNGKGYRTVAIFGRAYKAHRLAWAIVHGEWPTGEIDHLDHNPSNNCLENLRDVSRKENLRNRPPQKNNSSGHVGINWQADCKAWTASIGVDGRSIYLGLFQDKDAAIAARRAAEQRYGFHPSGGGYVSGRV